MTYSIVARDPATGQLGAAVQSHWFAVGAIVAWGEAGVGMVASQAFADPSYGPLGLDLMRGGKGADDALHALVTVDPSSATRQVAMVDTTGEVAAHTGERCVAAAGHRVGEYYSAQANMMRRDTVWDAMADAFEGAEGTFATRLLAALDAAEAEGGDIRGRQSAAILVVAPEGSGRPWVDRVVDLRVEDSPEPLAELRRLVDLKAAYDRMNRGDELAAAGDLTAALAEYSAAQEAVPSNPEMTFWRGVMLANGGRVEEARSLLAQAVGGHRGWVELLGRLPAAGLLPDDPGLVESLLTRPPEGS